MATTSPDNIWTPDSGDDYALTVDLAATADTVQDALTSIRGENGTRKGTTTQRNAATAVTGDYWSDTTDGFLYKRTGSTWFLAPGQLLGSMVGPTSNTTGAAGTLVGSIVSTPVLAIGQKVKITSRFSSFNGGGNVSTIDTSWRNSATNVTNAVRDGFTTSRGHTSSPGTVGTPGGGFLIVSASAAAKISAGIFLADGSSAVYGADGTYLAIESA